MKNKVIWVVAHQLPRDRIVALRWSEKDAEAKMDTIPDKHAPICYPFPLDAGLRLEDQWGYDPRLVVR